MPVEGQPRARVLERFPIFRELPAERLEWLLAQGRIVHAPRDSRVFAEREACRGFPLVLEGGVRVVKAAPNGREIVLYRVEPGEGCVLSGGCLLAHAGYSATGIAAEQSEIFLIPPAAFEALLLGFEPFRRFVFAMYGQRLAEVATLVEEVAFRRLDARLAQLLVRRGPVVATTHQALADELGSVREIVSRLLRGFEERRWVELERERVTVRDAAALAELGRG